MYRDRAQKEAALKQALEKAKQEETLRLAEGQARKEEEQKRIQAEQAVKNESEARATAEAEVHSKELEAQKAKEEADLARQKQDIELARKQLELDQARQVARGVAKTPGARTSHDAPPRILKAAEFRYPPMAVQNGANPSKEYFVQLKINVDVEGNASNVVLIDGPPTVLGFNEIALEAARRTRYSPATKGGRPCPGILIQTYKFKARNTQ